MEKIRVGNMALSAGAMDLLGVKILAVQTGRGALVCGYFSLETAEKFGHALAIVRGVASYEDMLNAEVAAVSTAAAALGVTVGMSGLAALQKMY